MFFILFALSVTTSFGRLGETQEECILRYGKPTASNIGEHEHVLLFDKNNIGIYIRFCAHIADDSSTYRASYVHYIKNNGVNFTPGEVKELLNSNRDQYSWSQDVVSQSKTHAIWRRSDTKASAIYDLNSGMLVITYDKYYAGGGNITSPTSLEGF